MGALFETGVCMAILPFYLGYRTVRVAVRVAEILSEIIAEDVVFPVLDWVFRDPTEPDVDSHGTFVA